LFPENQLKLRNYWAEDVLNTVMVHLMKQYQLYLAEKGKVFSGVIEFLEQTSTIVRIFKDMRTVKYHEDDMLQQLEKVDRWFQNWENSVSKEEKSKYPLNVMRTCIHA
jgi:hypothetical protein